MAIKHRFVSPKADAADSTLVNPSNWNDTHEIEPGSIGATELNADLGVPETRRVLELKHLFAVSKATRHVEPVYSSGLITEVGVWETPAKTTKLFTRTITYAGSQPVSVVTVDEVGGSVLTTTVIWSGDTLVSATDAIT